MIWGKNHTVPPLRRVTRRDGSQTVSWLDGIDEVSVRWAAGRRGVEICAARRAPRRRVCGPGRSTHTVSTSCLPLSRRGGLLEGGLLEDELGM